jgi:hypothetical protein
MKRSKSDQKIINNDFINSSGNIIKTSDFLNTTLYNGGSQINEKKFNKTNICNNCIKLLYKIIFILNEINNIISKCNDDVINRKYIVDKINNLGY